MKTSDGISQEQYEELCGKIQKVLNDYATALQDDNELSLYLNNNPFPEDERGVSDCQRRYFLLLNRAKNWIAKEHDKQDGGSAWKKKFKQNPEGDCSICRKRFQKDEIIEFHHTCRDGRKPTPVHKDCHDSLNKLTSNKRT